MLHNHPCAPCVHTPGKIHCMRCPGWRSGGTPGQILSELHAEEEEELVVNNKHYCAGGAALRICMLLVYMWFMIMMSCDVM